MREMLNILEKRYVTATIAKPIESDLYKADVFEPETSKIQRAQKLSDNLAIALGISKNTKDSVVNLEALSKQLVRAVQDAGPALQEYQAVPEEMARDYGNKHTNLVRQAHLLDALKLPGVTVPMPLGISTAQVHQLLLEKAPAVYDHWKTLGDAYARYQGKEPFLQTPQPKELLESIDQCIKHAFKLAETQSFLNKEQKQWLAEKENSYLMVRSTGAEDSEELSNAGGNLSVAYVPNAPESILQAAIPAKSEGAPGESKTPGVPSGARLESTVPDDKLSKLPVKTPDLVPSENGILPDSKGSAGIAVLQAVGDVVRSYFRTQSLQNRLNANSKPFAEELRLAVTLQELIGEEVGGAQEIQKIPCSLVLFTNEPLFIGDEEFRVMRFSATYGHGEGVVGNHGIATDTIYVLHSLTHPDQLQIFYDTQDKPTRLAPVENPQTGRVELKEVKNPEALRRKRVLNNVEIARLFQWGLIGEGYFNVPTDMEIVVRGDTIYPVQARPVNRKHLVPTFIDLRKSHSKTEAFRAKAFVPGRASVIEITNEKQVLIADTLEEAEQKFNKDQHRVVIVSQREPANSHPVVNFSQMGVTCLAVPLERRINLNKWLKELSTQGPLAICPQSDAIYRLAKSQSVHSMESQGFVAHPAQISHSFESDESEELIGVTSNLVQKAPEAIEELLMKVNLATNSKEAISYLQQLRTHSWVADLKTHRNSLEIRLQSMTNPPVEASRILKAAKQLEARINQLFEEVELAFQEGRMAFLIRTKALGTLLSEDQAEGINQFSIVSMRALLKSAVEMADYQEQLGDQRARFIDLLMEGERTPDSSVYAQWKLFLLKLEKLEPDQTAAFLEMMAAMKKSGAIATWMTLYFPQEFSKTPTTYDVLNVFKTHYPEADRPVVQKLLSQIEQTRQLRHRLIDFGDSKKFEPVFQSLLKISETMTEASLGTGDGILLNHIRLQLRKEFVDLFDSAIKGVLQGNYSDTEKVTSFRRMLLSYQDLLRDWSGKIGYHVHDVNKCLGLDPEQLHPSHGFDVSAWLLQNKTGSTSYHISPKTLADHFTLIHQSLLQIIGSVQKESNTLDSLTGKQLKSLQKLWKHRSSRTMLTGIVISEDQISIQFAIPIYFHGAMGELTYHRATNKTVFSAKIFGDFTGMGDRWKSITRFIESCDERGSVHLLKPVRLGGQYNIYGAQLVTEVTPGNEYGVQSIFQRCIGASMGTGIHIGKYDIGDVHRTFSEWITDSISIVLPKKWTSS